MKHKSDCIICNAELEYQTTTEPVECVYCYREYESNVKCKNNHYICDNCHSSSANEIIKRYTIGSDLTNPVEQAITLMKNPEVKMHGPEHHFLIPAVLLSSYYNVINSSEEKSNKIIDAEKRSGAIIGGFCGFYGTCGASIGTGIFISLITNCTPLSKIEWGLSNLMVAQSLNVIARSGGPRCCKRTAFLAMGEAIKFIEEHFSVAMRTNSNIKCVFSSLNNECLENDCSFFP